MAGLEKISFGEGNLPGYIGGSKGKPSVIVLQEWWGVTEEIKRQAIHISKLGDYRVLIPDLYKGKLGVNAEEASHLMNNLDFQAAVGEIGQAVKYLKSEGAPKVAAIGFCMGGSLSLLAAEYAGVDAAVSFYGTPPAEFGHPDKVKVPVEAHTGSDDSHKGFSDPTTVKPWIAKLKESGGNGEYYEYSGEGHAFMNSGEDIKKAMATGGLPTDIKKENQDAAWSRVSAFFAKHLKA